MYGSHIEIYQKKFSGFGWHTVVIDGHDFSKILAAFEQAKQLNDQPTAILARTTKGKGVSFLEDKEGWHGKPLKKGNEMESALAELHVSGDPRPVSISKPSESTGKDFTKRRENTR